MKRALSNPYMEHLTRQARFVEAAAAYCARHEQIARVTKDAQAVAPCCGTALDPASRDVNCTSLLDIYSRSDLTEAGRYYSGDDRDPPRWWMVKPEIIEAQCCRLCQERVRLWQQKRALKAGIGGLKRSMLRAYRALATPPPEPAQETT